MKYIVVCGDGMSDRPLKELGGKTPLEVAKTPNMDYIAGNGEMGLLKTMLEGLPKDSGVANLAILGYDPLKYYPGRGPLEAANMRIQLKEDDIIVRCNTITVDGNVIVDYSGGHISSAESHELVNYANEKLGGDDIILYPGVAYRHVGVLKNHFSDEISCHPPHDIIGGRVDENMILPVDESAKETADVLNRIMTESKSLLENHPVNQRRVAEGKRPANMLWFWGAGKKPVMPSFRQLFGLSGSIISAVDIIKGIGISAGLEVVDVPGATGYLDTNYEGKADAALKSLERLDFAYVHVESPDESGHEKNIEHKIQAIEDLDKSVIGRILEKIRGDYVIGVLPDHATPISVGTHTDDPVPFAIYSPKNKKNKRGVGYSEENAKKGVLGMKDASTFMKLLIKTGKE
ncbi:MAG: cofactor-independent phosphoglycerate mutase [Candidatus Altiarchaeota archaeon]